MPSNILTCPHCLCEAQAYMFENIDSDKLKCRRCRSSFTDPSAFVANVSYADCDSPRVVTRFPFALNSKDVKIRVRNGYIALLLGGDGGQQWLIPGDHTFHSGSSFQLFYVYLRPWILWGTKNLKAFGAYGNAQLTLTDKFVQSYCGPDQHVLSLEAYLRGILNEYITDFIQQRIDSRSTGQLEHTDGYLAMLGNIEPGVTLSKIEPLGYRTAAGRPSLFPTFASSDISAVEETDVVPVIKPPLEIVKTPTKSYTIKNGVEEVFVMSKTKAVRHKAGEIIEPDDLRGVQKLLRFNQKQFELSYGWGVFNQDSPLAGYFSAHGTVSFCIDGTVPLSLIIAKTSGWKDFEEQFFINIFRKELSSALKEVISTYVRKGNFQADRISEYLSSMSVDLTNQINGEGSSEREPALRKYGLRISTLDILDIDFYTKWR